VTEEPRYLGSGALDSDTASLTGAPPSHLPARLTISLWDFSWYTRAEDGGPYADLDAACAKAAELGYNTIRICAAPLLLFGNLGLDGLATDLEIEGLGKSPDGGFYGRGTRWYDAPGGYHLQERLLDLFDAAARHGLVVILASWEYQQSTVFAGTPAWFDAIDAVPLHGRYRVLADAWDRLIGALTAAGHRERIALVELHNEVDFSILPALADGGTEQLHRLRSLHPDLLVPPAMANLPTWPCTPWPTASARRSSTSTVTECWTRCSSRSTSALTGLSTSPIRPCLPFCGPTPRRLRSTDAWPTGSAVPPW
jgi:hypothetical protein